MSNGRYNLENLEHIEKLESIYIYIYAKIYEFF